MSLVLSKRTNESITRPSRRFIDYTQILVKPLTKHIVLLGDIVGSVCNESFVDPEEVEFNTGKVFPLIAGIMMQEIIL